MQTFDKNTHDLHQKVVVLGFALQFCFAARVRRGRLLQKKPPNSICGPPAAVASSCLKQPPPVSSDRVRRILRSFVHGDLSAFRASPRKC
jgi:hypothetical protein